MTYLFNISIVRLGCVSKLDKTRSKFSLKLNGNFDVEREDYYQNTMFFSEREWLNIFSEKRLQV